MQLSGKTIFISGSSSGLGAACAQRFIERGANIIGLDRTSEPTWLHSWNTSQPWHSRYFHVQADVTDDTSVQLAVQSGIQRFGELSGLICCAGILHGERILGRDGIASLDAFRKVIEVNVIGTFNLVRYCAESMARNAPSSDDGERGVIIMTSSIASQDGQIGQTAYAASKGAVAAMTLPIARELGRAGIRVVSLAPGVFDTPMMQAASEKVRAPLLEACVFPKRFGMPEEYAAMAEHVFSNCMLNGTVLRLDGALRM